MSKALEAAADAYAIDHWDMKLLALPAEKQERARRRAKEIIRAFAENISEAQCYAGEFKICCDDGSPHTATPEPENIRAAILEGLK